MALQNEGVPISFSDINVELGNSSNATLSLGSQAARDLAGIPSGAISLFDFYGESSYTYPYLLDYRGNLLEYFNSASTFTTFNFTGGSNIGVTDKNAMEVIMIPYVASSNVNLTNGGLQSATLTHNSSGYSITITPSASSVGQIFETGIYSQQSGVLVFNQYNDSYPSGFPTNPVSFGLDVQFQFASGNPIVYLDAVPLFWSRSTGGNTTITPPRPTVVYGYTQIVNASRRAFVYITGAISQGDIIIVSGAQEDVGSGIPTMTFSSSEQGLEFYDKNDASFFDGFSLYPWDNAGIDQSGSVAAFVATQDLPSGAVIYAWNGPPDLSSSVNGRLTVTAMQIRF